MFTLNQLTRFVKCRLEGELTRSTRRLFVAIDGPDCSGKTTLCSALVTALKSQHTILPVHFDDYLNDKRFRQRRGRWSEEGFRRDFFDATALIDSVLRPLRCCPPEDAPRIVLVEGLFLLARETAPFFDVKIRLEISDAMILSRALARDPGRLGTKSWVKTHYLRQCIPAQRTYIRDDRPADQASYRFVVSSDNRYEHR